MRLVVDTNRVIAALIKDSISRRIILHLNAELITIPLLKEEILKHKQVVISKSGVNETELDLVLQKLYSKMIFLSEESIKKYRQEAIKIMDQIDPDDSQFIAVALATKADIWSDDKHFQQQKKIKVWKTKDLIDKI